MSVCVTCGNDYDKAFQVTAHDGTTYTFDSVECMAAEMAPRCDHCGVRILGHGLEARDAMFCCDHCAEAAGVTGLNDRVYEETH
jgi:DNA-directed RNA polymerase subunit RPC12/RpoP